MIIGAILTQNVSWRSAAAAIDNLKREGILSIEGILSCDPVSLAALVRPARYHNQKAKKLQSFCHVIAEEFGGELASLLSLDMETLRKKLLSIYGIGPETADCIILYAAEKPILLWMPHTRRIFPGWDFFRKKISYRSDAALLCPTFPGYSSL